MGQQENNKWGHIFCEQKKLNTSLVWIKILLNIECIFIQAEEKQKYFYEK